MISYGEEALGPLKINNNELILLYDYSQILAVKNLF